MKLQHILILFLTITCVSCVIEDDNDPVYYQNESWMVTEWEATTTCGCGDDDLGNPILGELLGIYDWDYEPTTLILRNDDFAIDKDNHIVMSGDKWDQYGRITLSYDYHQLELNIVRQTSRELVVDIYSDWSMDEIRVRMVRVD